MGIRDWLAIIVIIFIVLILLDGFRRKWLERKNRIVMKLDKSIPKGGDDDDDVLVKSELPNGGARTKARRGGPEEVPVLMESVDLAAEEIEEYPESGDLDTEEDGEMFEEAEDFADVMAEDEAEDDWASDGFPDDDDDLQGASGEDDDQDSWSAAESLTAADDDESEEVIEPVAKGPAKADKRGFLGGRSKSDERIEPTFGDQELTFSRDDQGELDLEHNDLFDTSESDDGDDDDHQEAAEEVIIINVMARPSATLEGSKLLPVLLKHGMRLGEMSIFHRHAGMDGKGPVMFSMANMLKPGTFSISEMDTFATPGVSFFMQLPNKVGNMQCFEQMLKTAEAVKNELDAQLKDENRSVFTRQTIEHSRQRIRDFELEMLARK